MRFALWLIGLFGVAVAIALFAGSNPGTVTVFWPPYRVDLSLNLVLLVLCGAFALLHFALRALAALLALPAQAERWRAQQRDRVLHAQLLDALELLGAGRWQRAAAAARELLARLAAQPLSEIDAAADPEAAAHAHRLRVLAHWLLAESAHARCDRSARDAHFAAAQQALSGAAEAAPPSSLPSQQALRLRAAQWALDDRQPDAALAQLQQLPHGAARRIAARRLRLRAARAARQTGVALLEAQRLLGRDPCADRIRSSALLQRLALAHLAAAGSADAVELAWSDLGATARALPAVALAAATRWHAHGGAAPTARAWVWPVARRWLFTAGTDAPAALLRVRILLALEQCAALSGADARATAARAEVLAAQQASPRDPLLQYAAGVALLHEPGSDRAAAQALLEQAVTGGLPDPALEQHARRALARLAERRADAAG